MQELVVVNACGVLSDPAVQSAIAPLQKQIDDHFLPQWSAHGVMPVKVSFATIADIPHLDPRSWPIFLNKHSPDEGALGWHDDDAGQSVRTYSRVYVGDCLRFGLNWEVTLGHEALEMMLDPDVRRVFRMLDGRYAAFEACDAVEADDQAYDIDGHAMTNFVLPAYFTNAGSAQFDYRGKLQAPCPALTPGGYMSIRDTGGRWQQVTADRADGLAGRRALAKGYRRQARARWLLHELDVVDTSNPPARS